MFSGRNTEHDSGVPTAQSAANSSPGLESDKTVEGDSVTVGSVVVETDGVGSIVSLTWVAVDTAVSLAGGALLVVRLVGAVGTDGT